MDYNIKKNIPLAVFCLYFLKISFISANYTEAAILLILGSIAAIYEFKNHDRKFHELEEKLALQQKQLDDRAKELESVKNAVASIKLSSGMRSMGTVTR